MLPTNLTKFTVSQIDEVFNRFKAENEKRMVPLRKLLSDGKEISQADKHFLDGAGNMVNEFLVLEKFKSIRSVTEASQHFNDQECKSLDLLILKSEQKTTVNTSAARTCKFHDPLTQNPSHNPCV